MPPPPPPTPSAGSTDRCAEIDTHRGGDRALTEPRDKPKYAKHCRRFNFGWGKCDWSDCKFAHVTSDNNDVKANEIVPEGDPRWVHPEMLQKLAIIHAENNGSTASTISTEPDKKKQKTSSQHSVEALTESKMQRWLNDARNEVMMPEAPFCKDIHKIKFNDQVAKRFACEHAEFLDDQNNLHRVEVQQETDIVWSAMLYGRDEAIMKHLKSCLLLGYKLRYEVKPMMLKKYGIKMENVLLLTESSLDEDAFQAVSFCWALKFVQLPQVHQTRVATVSPHLREAAAIDPKHVFLKVEAFRMDCKVSVISDLDLVVTNVEKICDYLQNFVKTSDEDNAWLQPGQVGVMQRASSRVTFHEQPRWKKSETKQGSRGRDYTPVSFCFALIKTHDDLLQRYLKIMDEPGSFDGVLSDQDLLGEVLKKSGFFLLNHDFIAFPSWWTHADVFDNRCREIYEAYQNSSMSNEEFASTFFRNFGAVHLSKAFDFRTNAESLKAKKAMWHAAMMRGCDDVKLLHDKLGRNGATLYDGYLHFLGKYWQSVATAEDEQSKQLLQTAIRAIAWNKPSPGLSKIIVTMGYDDKNRKPVAAPTAKPMPLKPSPPPWRS